MGSLFQLSLLAASRLRNTRKTRYFPKYTLSSTVDALWRDLQALSQLENYAAVKECAEALLEQGRKEGRGRLVERVSLVLARALNVLGEAAESEKAYKNTLEVVFGREFVYVSPYSFNLEVFSGRSLSPEYSFVFEEFVANVVANRRNRAVEELFYRMAQVHIEKKDAWTVPGIEMEHLPQHIREAYLEMSTEAFSRPEYLQEMSTLPISNALNSRLVRNIRSVFSTGG